MLATSLSIWSIRHEYVMRMGVENDEETSRDD